MFPFGPPENIKKVFGFLMFSGGSKKNIGIKRVQILLPFEFITHNFDLNRIRMDLFLKIH